MAGHIDGYMAATVERLNATLIGIDRTCLAQFEVGPLKLYARDLRAMTPEEIESACIGYDPAWEHWEEVLQPNGLLTGLGAWLPRATS